MELDLRGESHRVLEVKPKFLLSDQMMNWNPCVKCLIQSNTGVRMLTTMISVHRIPQRVSRGSIKNIYEQLKGTATNLSNNLNSPLSFAHHIQWLGTTVGEITHKGTLP